MRKRERLAQERRDARESFYELACEIVDEVLSLPMIQSNLEFSLRFPKLAPDEQAHEFEKLVELNSRRCVYGEPELGITPEFQCNYLIGIVDMVAHARPALERAIALCRKSGKPLPKPLREWEPSSTRPRPGGPRSQLQDATALRDHVIALAVSAVVDVQRDAEWPARLAVGPALPPPSRRGETICEAVLDVLTTRYGNNKMYHLPTYSMIRNAWRRYQRKSRTSVGRPLLPPQGLETVMHPSDGSGTPFRRRVEQELSPYIAALTDEPRAGSEEDGDGSGNKDF